MPVFDRAYAARALDRLSRVPLDATPQWGKMTPAQLFAHLAATVRYSMGEGPPLPFRGNWRSRWIFGPLILHGLAAIPRNIRLPQRKGAPETPPESDLESLRQTVEEYLARRDAGTLPAAMHPFFGELSARAWGKFHVRHFEHHMAQFGL
ncbi:MAG TPA: DUF1569 domain-containing protein [Candidatus Hydrogenedentes bacterium]|nr:DUF1569 domain-containing protein [Candidatus Hydrogenedentota bacterium]